MITDFSNGEFIKQTFSYESLMKRRVKKHSSFFQPIFEAVSNALEATRGQEDEITIRLKVSKSLQEGKFYFNCIEVEDTGCGFTKENLQRFFDLFNESKGYNNLGTGRIQFLHFFQHTEYHSVYYDEEARKKKQRDICLSMKYIQKEKTPIWVSNPEEVADDTPTGTTIYFYLPWDEKDRVSYEELTTDEVYDKMFTHYLGRLCLSKGNMQTISIEHYINGAHDDTKDRKISDENIPNVDYHDDVKVHYKTVNSTGDGFVTQRETETFEIDSFLLPSDVQKKNEIKLTSKNETVDAANVDFSFVGRAKIEEGKNMLCLISSSFLTGQDTDLRGKLNIYTKEEFLKERNLFAFPNKQIFIDDVQEEVTGKIILHYPAIKKIKEESEEDIDQVVEDFSLDNEIVKKIGRKTGEKASDFLSRYYDEEAEVEKDNSKKMRDIFTSFRQLDPSSKSFKKSFNAKVGAVNSLIPVKNKSSLSRYISSRTAAMNMLQMILEKDLECQLVTNKRKDNEKLIHDLLFPQGSMDALESNLWMLNEDFIHFRGFSNFKIKDLKANGIPIIRDDLDEQEKKTLTEYNKDLLGNKPDILLFPEEHKCIIIELKSDTADPTKYLNQAVQYAGLLRAFAKDEFVIDNFYLYLIAEKFNFERIRITNPLFRVSQYLDYVFLPNNPVYGGTRGEGALYMEVLKYSTLLNRAKLRNSIFSDKLYDLDEDEKAVDE
jgi:hypothetical protein